RMFSIVWGSPFSVSSKSAGLRFSIVRPRASATTRSTCTSRLSAAPGGADRTIATHRTRPARMPTLSSDADTDQLLRVAPLTGSCDLDNILAWCEACQKEINLEIDLWCSGRADREIAHPLACTVQQPRFHRWCGLRWPVRGDADQQ